jgi:hypothetical protein
MNESFPDSNPKLNFDKEKFRRQYKTLPQEKAEGDRNVGLFRFENKFVKVVKDGRNLNAEELERLQKRTEGMVNVIVPEEIMALEDGEAGWVLPLAEGISSANLTDEQIEKIPEEHWKEFEKTIRTLSEKGVATDLTKRSNFTYHPDKGFTFLDITTTTGDGRPTGKFIEKDGIQHYFAFERYPFFPKKYDGPKEMFKKIPKI